MLVIKWSIKIKMSTIILKLKKKKKIEDILFFHQLHPA